MQQIGQTFYKPFRLFSKLSWTKPKNSDIGAFHVISFSYSLALFYPSTYAKLSILVPEEQKREIIECKKLDPLERKVSVFTIPDIEMIEGGKLFSGPWNFMLLDFKEYDTTRTQTILHNISDNVKPSNYTMFSMVLLDPLFYSLYRSTSNSRSFGNSTIADVVSTVIAPHGKLKTLEKTKDKYKWCQSPNISDYNFIRSLLPYSKSTKGNINYHFFCYNDEAYYASIGSEPLFKARILIPRETKTDSYKSISGELVAERFISEKNVHIMDSGFVEKPENKNPTKDNLNTNNGGTYKSDSSTLIRTAIEDPVLQEIYVSNLRKRTMMVNRCISTFNSVITDFTPLSMIQVINNNQEHRNINDGNYYIMFLENNFGYNEAYPFIPYCRLSICSESDIVGREETGNNRRKVNPTTPSYSDNPHKPIRKHHDGGYSNKPDPFYPNPKKPDLKPPKSPAIREDNLEDKSDDYEYQIELIKDRIEKEKNKKKYKEPDYPLNTISPTEKGEKSPKPGDNFDSNYVGKPEKIDIEDIYRKYPNIRKDIENNTDTSFDNIDSNTNKDYIIDNKENIIVIENRNNSDEDRIIRLKSLGYDIWTSTYPKCYRKSNGRFFDLNNDREILKPAYAIPFNQKQDVVNWTRGVINKIWYISDLPSKAKISYEENMIGGTSFYPDKPEQYGIEIGLDDHKTKNIIEGKNINE